jgi:hypothetical protein
MPMTLAKLSSQLLYCDIIWNTYLVFNPGLYKSFHIPYSLWVDEYLSADEKPSGWGPLG